MDTISAQSKPAPQKLCGAKAKQTGQPCKKPGTGAGGRCRIHGGASLRGIESKTFKDGRTSKYAYLPAGLAQRVEQFASDPEITKLHHDIAFVDTRISQLASEIDTGRTEEAWNELKANIDNLKLLMLDIQEKIEAGVMPFTQFRSHSATIETIEKILSGSSGDQAFRDIERSIDLRRKLSETENKRIKEGEGTMTLAQVQTFVQFVVMTIRENVRDRSALEAISRQLASHGAVSPAPGMIDITPNKAKEQDNG